MEWKKIEKLKTFDLNYFIGKDTFGDKGFQNIFVYHTRIITIELKEDNDTNYIISWKSKAYIILNLHHQILHSCIK